MTASLSCLQLLAVSREDVEEAQPGSPLPVDCSPELRPWLTPLSLQERGQTITGPAKV